MKKFSFRPNVALIRNLQEPKKKKGFNFQRIVYLVILLLAIGWLLQFLYRQLFFIEASGQVLMEKTDVNLITDVRIKDMHIAEGDSVCEGQALFSYLFETIESQADIRQITLSQLQENKDRLDPIEKELVFNSITLSSLNQQLLHLNDRHKQVLELSVLDINNKAAADQIGKNKADLEAEITLLSQKITFLKDKQGEITAANKNISNGNSPYLPFLSQYKSPVKGITGQISKSKGEIYTKGETIMSIYNPNKIIIKGYFKLSYIDYVNKGDTVTIKLPDDSQWPGIVKQVYISTYELPKEFQKNYESTERNILAEIEPVKLPADGPKWSRFHKLNVIIVLKKHRLLNHK